MKKFPKIFFLFSFPLLSSCAYLEPYVHDLNLISVDQEKQLNVEIERQIAAEMTVLDDSALVRRVENIGSELTQVIQSSPFEYRFYVVEDPSPNAFTVPGGSIYVHTGLMQFVDDNHELAGVIAHEIGHAYERHPTKSMSRALGISYLSQMIFKKDPGQMKQIAISLAQGGIINKYGRADENEADAIGFYLLKESRFSSRGLLRFLKKLQQLQGQRSAPSFLSTHPPTSERIEKLEALERGALLTLKQNDVTITTASQTTSAR